MSYEPTNWKTGDVVTSAKLNKLENAVANGSVKMFTVSNIPGTMQAGLTPQDFIGAWIYDQSNLTYKAVTDVIAGFDELPYIPLFISSGQVFYYPEDGSIDDNPSGGGEDNDN